MPGSLRSAAMIVWESFLNDPYLWGGSGIDGVDCSGLALEGLKAVGLAPRENDYTAGGLLNDLFKTSPRITNPNDITQIGTLVFWANPDGSIRHVEIVWAIFRDRVLTIGASGGGSKTVDRAEAKRTDARVKIRRITPGWLCAVDPFAPLNPF